MYRGRHEVSRKGIGKYKKSHILLVSLLLIICIGMGTTVAFLMDSTNSIINRFDPAQVSCKVVETFIGGQKENVMVENTSNIPAYIRATYEVTWQKVEDGVVYIHSKKPAAGTDYTITMGNTGKWDKSGAFYYYDEAVAVGGKTDVLIASCAPVAGKAPDGYSLCVEIIADAVQAEPADAVQQVWGVTIPVNGGAG